ncbi:MAG TPA: hypothetical protein VMR75_04265, partial [Candidatus Saccharimonadales bacterium]|nr:hypothetical protein [Candidatus Saccharimonadales bacterium]
RQMEQVRPSSLDRPHQKQLSTRGRANASTHCLHSTAPSLPQPTQIGGAIRREMYRNGFMVSGLPTV